MTPAPFGTLWEKLRHPLVWPVTFESAHQLLSMSARKYNHPQEVAYMAEDVAGGLTPPEHALVQGPMRRRGRLLDVGCGAGREAIALASLGYTVVGLDMAEAMVEEARRQAQARGVSATFHVAAAHEVTLAWGAFDYILTTANLYHYIPTRRLRLATVEALARVLAPGGTLFLSAPWMSPAYHPGLRTRFVDALRRARRTVEPTLETEPGDQRVPYVSPVSDPTVPAFRHVFLHRHELEAEFRMTSLRWTFLWDGIWAFSHDVTTA